jgi:hypothetical protein
MDPISLIVAALAAGAAKIGGDAASDAYRALLRAVRHWFAGDQNGRWLVDQHAKEAAKAGDANTPGAWEQALREHLLATGAGNDAALREAAAAMLEASSRDPGQQRVIQRVSGEVKIGSRANVKVGGDLSGVKIDS